MKHVRRRQTQRRPEGARTNSIPSSTEQVPHSPTWKRIISSVRLMGPLIQHHVTHLPLAAPPAACSPPPHVPETSRASVPRPWNPSSFYDVDGMWIQSDSQIVLTGTRCCLRPLSLPGTGTFYFFFFLLAYSLVLVLFFFCLFLNLSMIVCLTRLSPGFPSPPPVTSHIM